VATRHERVVAFDVDDTLYLERDYMASGFAAVDAIAATRWGVSGFGAAAWRGFDGGARGDLFDRALAELRVDYTPDDVKRLVQAYRRHRPQIRMLPDARYVLAQLRAGGLGIAILTDGPRESQAAKVTRLGLRSYTDVVVLTDEWGPEYGKPGVAGFAHIAELTGARELAYVADNPAKDFAGPAALGWATVRVRRPAGLHAGAPDGVDVGRCVPDLWTVPDLLGPSTQWPLSKGDRACASS
jgi:putative hydrolase of the HAD superfamily